MIRYFKSLIKNNTPDSSKRFVGIVGSLCLFVAMFIFHTDTLIYCVTALTTGSLAITGVENIKKQ